MIIYFSFSVWMVELSLDFSQFLVFCSNFPIDEERKKHEDSASNCCGSGERETKMGEGSV